MSFLSNIGHSIAHIAQEAVHDIESAGGGGKLAETISGLAKTGLDSFMKDLGGGLEKLGSSFLHAPSASVQGKIFARLMKRSDKKEKELKGAIDNLSGKDQPSQADLANLQRVQNQMSELTQLTTNMMKSYKDMKDSIIGNIR